jgi:hypothetical protein
VVLQKSDGDCGTTAEHVSKLKKMAHFWQHRLAGQPQNAAELESINQVKED